jgi:L-alanine-DL-glutamate epimerase-like enolase superfamily enzyme
LIMPHLIIARETWPLAAIFTIARGSKSAAEVVTVMLEQDGVVGRGECVPYARYGESVDGVLAELEAGRAAIEANIDREKVPALVQASAARNALDCALWDLEAKRAGRPAWQLAGLAEPRPLITAYTLSLADPAAMGEAAGAAASRPLLKLKLGGPEDRERLAAVRRNAPASRLIVDANEGWDEAALPAMFAACAEHGVELIEQPLPAGRDAALASVRRPVAVCADESIHVASDITALADRYDAVNIKLDKTGGLTGALALATAAAARDMRVMVGCMVATSLAMAPAFLIAQRADYVDLDGPLLLQRDRIPAIRYDGSIMNPPPPELWG